VDIANAVRGVVDVHPGLRGRVSLETWIGGCGCLRHPVNPRDPQREPPTRHGGQPPHRGVATWHVRATRTGAGSVAESRRRRPRPIRPCEPDVRLRRDAGLTSAPAPPSSRWGLPPSDCSGPRLLAHFSSLPGACRTGGEVTSRVDHRIGVCARFVCQWCPSMDVRDGSRMSIGGRRPATSCGGERSRTTSRRTASCRAGKRRCVPGKRAPAPGG
jgi:hypothetical protein